MVLLALLISWERSNLTTWFATVVA